MKEIVDAMIYVLVIFIVCLLCFNICYAKLNNKTFVFTVKNLLLTLMTSIIMIINISISPIVVKIIVNLLVISAEFKIIFKDNLKKAVINYIFIFALMSIIEILLTKFLFFIGVITSNTSANTLTYINLALTAALGIIEYVLLSIKIIRYLFQKLINFFIENKPIANLIYIIFVLIVILSIFYIEDFTQPNSFRLLISLFIIFLLLIIFIIKLKLQEEMLKVTNKKLMDYNSNYGKFLDEYKIYKHNINHKLSNIKSVGSKKVNALIDDILNEETPFNIRNNEIYNVPNGIKGIVAEKLYNKNYNIVINNKIKNDPFIKLSPRAFNSLSECIGISLDNAIEASEKTKIPCIIIYLYEDRENLYIKVGNSFCNNIDLDEIGNKYYSTKNRGSGLGLFSIARNKLVKEQISIINNIYYIELQIKKAR